MKNCPPGDKPGQSQKSNLLPVFYEIKIQGRLDPQRSLWFGGMTLTYLDQDKSGSSCTLISGPVIDQPALLGLLTKIRDLNLTLISVQRSVPGTGGLEERAIGPEPPEERQDSSG